MKYNLLLYLSLLISILNFSLCKQNNITDYDILEYLKEIKYTLDDPEKKTMNFYLKMNTDEISSDSILINIHQRDPESIKLEYKMENSTEELDFKQIDSWLTINDGSEHVLLYDIEKPKEKGYTLYMKVSVSYYNLNQEIRVESTDHQFSFYTIIYSIVGASAFLTFIIILCVYASIYNAKLNPNSPGSFDVVFAKVGPEDY